MNLLFPFRFQEPTNKLKFVAPVYPGLMCIKGDLAHNVFFFVVKMPKVPTYFPLI